MKGLRFDNASIAAMQTTLVTIAFAALGRHDQRSLLSTVEDPGGSSSAGR
jgi:hypothetical protein